MPASMQGEMQPTIYRFKLGGFEVATIMDSKVIRSGLTPRFGGEAAAAEVKALAAANRIDADRYEHPFTPTLVNTGKELVLFDTGNGSLRDEHEQLKGRLPPGNLVARMAQAGYKPEDVDVVVITHGHPDHIGGLTKGGTAGVSQGALCVRRRRVRFLEEGRERARGAQVQPRALREDRGAARQPRDLHQAGRRGGAGHHARSTPSVIRPACWLSSSRARASACSTGPTPAGHYVVSLQRPDLHLDVDDDKEKAVATRKRILDMVATDRLFVAGFHMPFPGLGYVERAAAPIAGCRIVIS